jgi:hypothetical protein
MAVPRSRVWIGVYVVLGLLGLAALIVPFVLMPIVYQRQQLQREALEAARKRWEEKGPRDYRLEYTKRGSARGTYVVWVKNGQVVAVLEKQDENQPDESGRRLEPRLHLYYGMPALLDDIERFLQLQDGARLVAAFDPADGHLTWFSRMAPGGESLIIEHVYLQPWPAGKPFPDFLSR